MAQDNLAADLVGVKKFARGLAAGTGEAFAGVKFPVQRQAIELHPPCPARQLHHQFVRVKFSRRVWPQRDRADRVPDNGKLRADAHRKTGGCAQ